MANRIGLSQPGLGEESLHLLMDPQGPSGDKLTSADLGDAASDGLLEKSLASRFSKGGLDQVMRFIRKEVGTLKKKADDRAAEAKRKISQLKKEVKAATKKASSSAALARRANHQATSPPP